MSDLDIAIVGLACRFPGGPDPDSFFTALLEGKEAVIDHRRDALLASGVDPDEIDDRAYVPRSGALEGVELFDPEFFGLTQREAELIDPQHRLFLECAWEALEDAGYDPSRYSGRIGCYAGTGMSLYAGARMSTYFSRHVLPRLGELEGVEPAQIIIANRADYLTTRVSYRLDLRGPSLDIQTACSTSLVAVHVACQAVLSGECEMALAGGAAIHIPVRSGYRWSEGGILSPDGRCRPFDADARGTVGGSGAGVVLVKRLSDALADGDHVRAVIRGSAINNDGREKVSYTAPSVRGQVDVIRQALRVAGVSPETIGFVEAHGTGTALGDPVEVAALTQAYRSVTDRRGYCALGSVKSNIGHLDTAAGIAGLIKAVLAVERGRIPPTLHFRRPNPELHLESSPFFVNRDPIAWPIPGLRRAAVSSLGAGGTNAHVILEQAIDDRPEGATRPLHVLAISARTEDALRTLASRHASWLARHPDARIADVAFTVNSGRARFAHRAVAVGADVPSIRAQLEVIARGEIAPAKSHERPRIAFAFPGQGAHARGMGRELLRGEPEFRRAIDRCDAIARPLLGRSLIEILEGDGADLEETRLAQPALFSVMWSLSELWRSFGLEPSAVIGHSLGEYVAACVAGVFSLEDALTIAVERGRLCQSLAPGVMLAVFAGEDLVRDAIRGFEDRVSIAALNAPEVTVIAGEVEATKAIGAALEARGVSSQPLAVSRAFHSPLMEPGKDPLARIVERVPRSAPRLPLISTVTGRRIGAEICDPSFWAEGLRAPVRFMAGVRALSEEGYSIFLEIGPRPVLAPIGRASAPNTTWLSSGKPGREHATLIESVAELCRAGAPIDWVAFDRDRGRRRVPLPTYPFQRRRCWIDPPGAKPTISKGPSLAEIAWRPLAIGSRPAVLRGRFLVVEGGPIGAALAKRLESCGAEVERIDRDLEAVDRGSWSGIIHLGAIASGRDACAHVLALIQRALARESGPPPLWIATAGALGPEPTHPDGALIAGLVRTARSEHAELIATIVDLDPTFSSDESAEALLRELLEQHSEREVVLRRDRERLVPRLVPLEEKPRKVAGGGSAIITGGLGGLGLAVASRLVRGGFRDLILAGRRGAGPEARRAIDELAASGARILPIAADVTREEDVRRMIEAAESLAPLAGIVHAAGVVEDASLLRLRWEDAERVIAPKVIGARHLDRATQERQLRFFVCFSSIAGVLGSPGQAAYAAANAWLDAFAQSRRARGLPAISIAWGPWAEIGMAARTARSNHARRMRALSREEGLDLFERLIGSEAIAPIVLPEEIPIDPDAPLDAIARKLWAKDAAPNGTRSIASARNAARIELRRQLATAPPRRARELVTGCVRDAVASVIGASSDAIDPDETFQDLGLDSLRALELRNVVGAALDLSLPATIVWKYPTVRELAMHLGERLRAKDVSNR